MSEKGCPVDVYYEKPSVDKLWIFLQIMVNIIDSVIIPIFKKFGIN